MLGIKGSVAMKKLVIIPAYNEAENLETVVTDIQLHAPTFDYIIVNDCSIDHTRYLCEEKGYPVLHLPYNLGIGGAVQAGYLFAEKYDYDLAVQFDGDGQHDASYLDSLVDAQLESGADMIIGSRFIDKQGFQSTRMRKLGITFLSSLIALLCQRRIYDVTSGMRLVNRQVIQDFCTYYPSDYPEPETLALILRRGYKVMEIPVKMRARKRGRSSITPLRSIYYMVKVTLAIFIDALKPNT